MKPLIRNPVFHWSLIGTICIALMGTALFYQYVLETPPCVLCIHVRLWVTAIFGISIAGILLHQRRWPQVGLWLGFLLSSIALFERVWRLLGTENGWIMADCGIQTNPGLPAWFALHDWFPMLFRPETTCGISPDLLFGITMTEGSMAFAVLFIVCAFAGLLVAGSKAMDL